MSNDTNWHFLIYKLFEVILKGFRIRTDRNSHERCSIKKGVLWNFTKHLWKHLRKHLRKHLCQSLFFNKACNFIKKETLTQVFSCEFCEISKNTFFTEHLWTTASKQIKLSILNRSNCWLTNTIPMFRNFYSWTTKYFVIIFVYHFIHFVLDVRFII